MKLIDADAFDKCLLGAEIEARKSQKYVFSSAINTIRGNLANFPTVNQWIPVSERLPEDRECVLLCYREWQQYSKRYVHTIVLGWHANKHSVRENVFNEWEADCDYVEDEDEFYIHEGWYEWTTEGNSDWMNWFINAEVIAWMPLPEPWKGEE